MTTTRRGTKYERVLLYLHQNPDWVSSKKLSQLLAPKGVAWPDIYANEQFKKLPEERVLNEKYDKRGVMDSKPTSDTFGQALF